MAIPTPIGHIHYSEPRAVQIREGEELQNKLSAISGTVNIVATTVTERNKVLAGWAELMEVMNLKVEELIGRA